MNRRISRRTLILVSVALLVVVGLEIEGNLSNDPSVGDVVLDNSVGKAATPEQKAQQLNMSVARLHGIANRPPAAEEMEQDRQYFQSQVDAIEQVLAQGPGAEKRLGLVEQLGAYPVPEAAALLSHLLESDEDPGVRAMAAQTLAQLDPDPRSINALLGAFEDPSIDVQSASLLSLELLLSEIESDAQREKIINGLSIIVRESALNERLHHSMIELLSDHR